MLAPHDRSAFASPKPACPPPPPSRCLHEPIHNAACGPAPTWPRPRLASPNPSTGVSLPPTGPLTFQLARSQL
eukprot:131047-Chlamydomonas_euryale.AAC.2